jgi:hypothetical protein
MPLYNSSIEIDEIFYFTGRPCNKGHVAKRYKSTNQCKDCQKEYGFFNKRKYRLNRYGMTEVEYFQLLIKQDFKCAICKEVETAIDGATKETKVLSVDHCHKTEKTRGLLCTNCNQGIGKFKDDLTKLKAAVEYLEKYTI